MTRSRTQADTRQRLRSRHVEVGPLTLGNDLPFVLIAGPCQIESRDACARDRGRAGRDRRRARARADLQELVRQGQPDQRRQPARPRPRQGHRGAGRGARAAGLPGADRRPREPAVPAGGRGGRRAADPGVPLPADRSAGGRGRDRRCAARQEGPVPGALGHGPGRPQARAFRRRAGPARRARHELRLQHAGVGLPQPAADGEDRLAGRVRRHPFGAAAGRARRRLRRSARVRAGAGARRARGRRRRAVHGDPSRSRPGAERWPEHAAAGRAARPAGCADRLRPPAPSSTRSRRSEPRSRHDRDRDRR